jgi:glutathione synthase/RimK-type ligase-like ATP-grasp enzyme
MNTNPTSITGRIAVLYENEAWMRELFAALDGSGLAYDAIDVADAAARFDRPETYDLVINRVSPSADLRGNGAAIGRARRWLAGLEERGVRVINGEEAFRLETSKIAQHELIRDLGLRVPRTVVLDDRAALDRLDDDFPFPAIVKPDTGGSGAGVELVGSRADVRRLLDERAGTPAAREVLLLQEFLASADGSVMRMEFVDGELLFAMRVQPVNTFNLCPADGCERPPADADGAEADALFAHDPDVPADAVAEARAIVREAGLQIGGVEYIETPDGRRHFYDINATSTYRADVVAASGVDAMDRLVAFIESAAARPAALQAA